MLKTRVIPTLLLRGAGLVKTTAFSDPVYVGDPINAIRIFNDKEVDELVLLDITASRTGKGPGIRHHREHRQRMLHAGRLWRRNQLNVEQVRRILSAGVEKVVINTAALAESASSCATRLDEFGSQAIVVSIDVKRKWLGRYEVYGDGGTRPTGHEPVALRQADAGSRRRRNPSHRDRSRRHHERLRHRTDRRGSLRRVSIPVIASGGAGTIADFGMASRQGGAAAVAAGAMFVFHGPHRAVLITYPSAGRAGRGFLN